MNYLFKVCLMILFCMNNISYAQSIECDNNFGDCGQPNQSGGGGGGGGSVLINNTDLGDTYQHADDFDDDGIEDSSDNCLRVSNPHQYDSDGDGIGDACDNCLSSWNPDQDNHDNDELGDVCDNDSDGDGILNEYDSCPLHFGDYCSEEYSYAVSPAQNNVYYEQGYDSEYEPELNEKESAVVQNCNSSSTINLFSIYLIGLISILRRKLDWVLTKQAHIQTS